MLPSVLGPNGLHFKRDGLKRAQLGPIWRAELTNMEPSGLVQLVDDGVSSVSIPRSRYVR
jgi:hypothetical protein